MNIEISLKWNDITTTNEVNVCVEMVFTEAEVQKDLRSQLKKEV